LKTTQILFLVFLLFPAIMLYPESFRAVVEGNILVAPEKTNENTASIGINGSAIINLGADIRFINGIELEITAPQTWLSYRGALVMMMFSTLNPKPNALGIIDLNGRRIAFEPLPSRLRIVYHIPIRNGHGLRTTTSVTVPTAVIQPGTFPILFRLMTVEKGLPAAFEQLSFSITARPIFSNEGAVRIIPRYPPQLRNRPFTVLINDNVINNISEEIILREGEHHLVILSEDYRNESRRFIVERTKTIELTIDLQDPTPIIIFEGPQNAEIFLNNTLVTEGTVTVEPGVHEVRFRIGDYTVIRSINVQRGKTYRISLDIDLNVHEED